MASATQLLGTLQASYATLTVRERRLVAGGLAAAAAFVVFLVIMGFSSRADAIRMRTQKRLAWLEEAQTLAAGYRDARAAQESLERQLASSNVRLITYLEDKAQKSGLELPSINPKGDVQLEGTKIVESGVELTLTDVRLDRLVELLTAIEAGPGIVRVKYLRLEPRAQNETVTAWLTVVTYHLKG